jgi:RNA polymerase sigma-70 factor (ECF subfamily)
MPRSDQELAEHARRGDRAATELLVTRALPKVRGLARKLARDPEEGDALAQEAMVVALEQLGRYRGEAGFATWVCAIAVRRRAEALRRRAREQRHEADLSPVQEPDPAEIAAADDTAQRLLAMVAYLPPAYAEAILARATADSAAEAAASLGLTDGAFRTRLHRARLALRARLLETYPEWREEVSPC